MNRFGRRIFVLICIVAVVCTSFGIAFLDLHVFDSSTTSSRVATINENQRQDVPESNPRKWQPAQQPWKETGKENTSKQHENPSEQESDDASGLVERFLTPAKKSAIGYSSPVSVRAHPDVRKVSNDLRRDRKASASNQFASTTRFDPDQYRRTPEAYLDAVEPGRVFDTAQPGPDVAALKRLSPGFTRVLQGETVLLRAQTEPGAPVSFTSARLGEFQNHLTAITVAANEQGIAQVTFKAAGGTQGDIDVMAASPVASGHIHFYVNVQIAD